MTMKIFALLLSLVLLDASISARAASLKSNELVSHTCLSDTTEGCDLNSVSITEEDLSEQISAMMGHLRAGLALFEIAEYGMGTPHLLHPIRETSEAQKNVLRSYGFDERAFESLAESARAGSVDSAGMTQVLFLISSMESLQSRLSSNPYRNISTLLELAKEEYGIAIKGDVVVDVSEYQDSYGFILEAKQQSRLLEPTDAAAVLSMLEEIQVLWIDGVSTPIKATPVPSVAETIEAAIQKLGSIERLSAKRAKQFSQ